MVFGEDAEAQLAPFQENNMGDCPAEYLVFNDETEYLEKEWADEDEETKTAHGNDFDQYVAEYHGYSMDEELGKYGYWENSNAKWDYYRLGGRYTGFFKVIKNPSETPIVGRAGLFGEPAEPGTGDAVRKRDIDFLSMVKDTEENAGKTYDEITSITGPALSTMYTWHYVRETMFKGDVDGARNFYNGQEAPKLLAAWNVANGHQYHSVDLEDFQASREEYCRKRGNASFSTFAVIKDGVWYEKGKMGWWAMVADEKNEGSWNEEVKALIDSVSDDTLISVYDCHI